MTPHDTGHTPLPTIQPAADLVGSDDVAALQDFLQLPAFHYEDVAVANAHAGVLQRWPLLNELAAGTARPPHGDVRTSTAEDAAAQAHSLAETQ